MREDQNMRLLKGIVFSFHIIFFTYSCNTDKQSKIEISHKIEFDFKEIKGTFQHMYVEHFPDNHPLWFYQLGPSKYKRGTNLCLFAAYPFDENKGGAEIKNNPLYTKINMDDNIFFREINSYSHSENQNENIQYHCNNNDSFTVLSFYNINEILTKYLSNNNKSISDFIDENKVVYYLLEKDTTHKYIEYVESDTMMPKGYKHGFTKGVYISEVFNQIVYWVEFW